MVLLVVGGILVVLVGMLWCTYRVERFWKTRSPKVVPYA